jgi:integrase
MAGTVRYTKIETRTARMKLKPGKKMYWRNLVLGRLSVGYQRKASGLPGRWVARTTLGGDRWRISPLGLADDYADAASPSTGVLAFEDAAATALKSFRAEGGPATIVTVADAIADYVEWLKAHRASGSDAEGRAKKLILPALGRLRLSELTTARLNSWRDALAEAPALLRTGLAAPQRYKKPPTTVGEKRARRATANRTWSILRGALNRAFVAGYVEDDTAWRRVKPFAKVSAARPGYLTVAEGARLINGADPDFRPLVKGALLTGCRYGELLAARVRDYVNGKLHVARSKSGRPRDVVLTEEGVAFFAALSVGRAGDVLLFTHANGEPWSKSQQAQPMREACERASIKPAVGFHQLAYLGLARRYERNAAHGRGAKSRPRDHAHG